MLIIGLTGGMGSGKTTVSRMFAKLGVNVIDADSITRELTIESSPVLKKITTHFGEGVLQPNGQLNRKQLREIIFQDSNERKWLENLLHPLVYKEIARRLKTISAPYCIVSIPLLLETGRTDLVDRILVVLSNYEEQIKRSRKRDKLTDQEANKILATQVDNKTRIIKADDILYNISTTEYLQQQVKKLHQKYLHLLKLAKNL